MGGTAVFFNRMNDIAKGEKDVRFLEVFFFGVRRGSAVLK